MGFFSINWKFLPIKLHYVLFYAGTGTVQPTMPIYAKVLGFSTFVVGIIFTILPILGLIIKPAFGALADRFKWHRIILIIMEILIIIVYLGIWFIPPAHPNVELLSVCSVDNDYYFHFDGNNTTWDCRAYVDNTTFPSLCTGAFQDQCVLDKNPPVFETCSACEDVLDDTYSQWQFWVFLVLLIVAWGGTAVVTTFSDTVCIEICQDPYLYGKQRFWGSLSWGLLSLINGVLIDAVSEEGQEKNYASAFYLMIVPLIADVVLSYKLKFDIPQQSENIAKDIWRVMLVPRNLVFLIWCIMVGVSFALLWNFLYWYLEDLAALEGPSVVSNIKTIEGLVAGIECFIGETPAFFFAGWILSKIGHGHSMSLIFATIGLRYTLYSILGNPWWCLPIEILQNQYGLFYATMTSYAKVYAPPGIEATMQGILCAACEGIGVAIGSFLGGYFYDNYGGSVTFRIFGVVFFVTAILSEISEATLQYFEKKSQKKNDSAITASHTNQGFS